MPFQSTHPRGVRRNRVRSRARHRHFNPRTHVGCDMRILPRYWSKTSFQSTHPRGVRRRELNFVGLPENFNPRTHVGCDLRGFARGIFERTISIHAPTWGATKPSECNISTKRISIHAPTWGATSRVLKSCAPLSISIHAPTWGATIIARLMSKDYSQFQSTHPRGVRLGGNSALIVTLSFQSTHPRGVRRKR